jgi:hypothetical protein
MMGGNEDMMGMFFMTRTAGYSFSGIKKGEIIREPLIP